MRKTVAMMTLLVLSGSWSCAADATVRAGAGVAKDYGDEEAATLMVSWASHQRHPWEVMLGHIAEREGVEIPAAAFLALSKRFYWRAWFVSGGVAMVSVDNDQLSGHAQFLTAIGYDFGRVSVSLRHLSNGSTQGRNRGETFLLAEFAF